MKVLILSAFRPCMHSDAQLYYTLQTFFEKDACTRVRDTLQKDAEVYWSMVETTPKSGDREENLTLAGN